MSEEIASPPENMEVREEARGFRSLVGYLAVRVGHLGRGDAAELRRLNPDQPWSAVYWRLLASFTRKELFRIGGKTQDDAEKRWSVVLRALVHTGELNNPEARLGRALAEAGYHELRMVRLLRAREEALLDEVSRVAKFLSVKAEPFDFCELASLIENGDRPWAEKFRANVARSYYEFPCGKAHAL